MTLLSSLHNTEKVFFRGQDTLSLFFDGEKLPAVYR
jgi:hypothetical protein